ncbi:FAD/NAD(P)-binding protein [Cryptosporangium aurantiacum]|uniref:FAD-NAD(P)-binding n=1 Tax=Cryptosporangium aurantiacum TaxID=134849 RepID=A0A1M7NDI4_9ACTN|nr:FAD/NAD(P)-binding protein [Cryptosporangium aurantiacum]SHN01676.1 FAD-NAD(P)-binding [Cryptosporangium aurantiacum]
MTAEPARLVVVGAGPGATGLLERLIASAPELLGDRPLQVTLVDPHPPGAGRVWRADQSPLLLMNSMAEDVTMFPDETVLVDGPLAPGPALHEWADETGTPGVEGRSFVSRHVQSGYLTWVFDQVRASAPANIRIETIADRAVRIEDGTGSAQRVHLAGRTEPLEADVVVLALGHLDAEPTGETARLAQYARAHDLTYVPPAYTADLDLAPLQPGQDVLVRGLGLAFVDLVVLLTEGRGGRFLEDGSYAPSGREPRLHVGSGRGVPYHAKTGYRLAGPPPKLPRFFGPEQIDALPDGPLEFRRDVWPLIAKEIGWGYYHELFAAHSERTTLPWDDFAAAYAAVPWYSDARVDLVASAVPAEEDRLDLDRLDRPFAETRFADDGAVQAALRHYIHADVVRRNDQAYSADLGAFLALLSIYGQLPRVLASGRLTGRSQVEELDGWWHGFFSFLASGPPAFRLEQLLALSRAGIVHFLGPDVRIDGAGGRFRACSPAVDTVVEADAVVEARLPKPTVVATADELLRDLMVTGQGVEETVDAVSTGRLRTSRDNRVIDRYGEEHPRRFAIGWYTSSRGAAAFARPRTNAAPFRMADQVARAVLSALGASVGSATPQC